MPASETVSVTEESDALQFPHGDMVITTNAMSHYWAFYFQGSGFPVSCYGTWSGSMCKVHITLQELQAVSLRLHKLAFSLSGKVVVLHLDNSTTKAYLCNQGGTSLFLSRLACHTFNLADKHGITLIQCTCPPSQCGS